MDFESNLVRKTWTKARITLLYKGKGERTKHNSHGVRSLLKMFEVISPEVLEERVLNDKDYLMKGKEGIKVTYQR